MSVCIDTLLRGHADAEVINMVNLSPKERSWLKELKDQEKLCIEKYAQYASRASDNRLKCLFQELKQHEENHLTMLETMDQGNVPAQQGSGQNAQSSQNTQSSQNGWNAQNKPCHDNVCSQQDWEQDKFLCQDALSMEKHVSACYDTGVFEFRDPGMRDALNRIQKQEQEHGEKIWQYMNENNMYN